MPAAPKVSPVLQSLIEKGLFERLPATFTTYFYDRIRSWDLLFPAEQNYFERLFLLIDRSEPAAAERIFRPVFEIERRMGVSEKTFPRGEFTLGHVDFLNRSPYLSEWRAAIAEVFAEIDPVLDRESAKSGRRRLIVVTSPAELPVSPDRMWQRLQGRGKRVALDSSGVAQEKFLDAALGPLAADYASRNPPSPYDAWCIEAGDRAGGLRGGVRLSYEALAGYRRRLMDRVQKGIAALQIPGPRELGKMLREIDLDSGSAEIDRDPLLRDFARSILLAGNGTLLINNTFVEWAAVQAARRARPSLAVISFGVRNKVKPFSSLLIFADQETATPVPSQMDMLGTYVDLEIFHSYVLAGFEKYVEYRRQAAFLFLGEGMEEMLAIAPAGFPLDASPGPLRLEAVQRACRDWMGLP
jgi:hypothetical protein